MAETGRAPATDATMADLLSERLDLAERDLSPTTIGEYPRLARARVVPAIGSVTLAKLSAVHLDRLYIDLQASGLSPASVRRVHALCRRALSQAVRWGWAPTNVAAAATPPKVAAPRVEGATVDQVKRLVAAAEGIGPAWGAFVRVAAGTGMRRGELVGLAWDRVDLEAGVVTVERTVVESGGVCHVKGTKSGRGRQVTVSGGTLAALVAQRVRAEKLAADAGVRAARDGWVWSREPDGSAHWLPGTVSSRWARTRAAARLDRVRLHDLRHAHVTALLDAGVPVETVAARVGHAYTSMTLDVYSHPVAGRDAEAARVVDGLLD